jgi:hypothetical protein
MAGIAGRAIPPGECIRGRKACGYGDSARRSNGEKSRAFNSTIGHVRERASIATYSVRAILKEMQVIAHRQIREWRSTINRKMDPVTSASPSSSAHCVSRMPGLRPVLVKGIQAALTRRSDPPSTKLAPLWPRGRGAGMPAPLSMKVVVADRAPRGRFVLAAFR